MAVAVIMAVGMVMAAHRDRHAIGLAGAGALPLAEGAALGEPLHMVMVAVLGSSHLGFKTQHLGPVLAKRAVHVGVAPHHFCHPLREGLQNAGMVGQIGGLHELHLGMVGSHPLAVLHDPAHQNPGEQEVGEHHDAPEAQFHGMAQPRLHEGKGDAGIHRFSPAEAEALHQHPRHLGDVGVGVGIGGSAAHHHQQRVVQGHRLTAAACGISPIQGLPDPGTGRLDHLQIHPQFAAVIHPQAGFSGPGVEHRGDVVLGVACSKEHGRHGQYVLHPLLPQGLKPIAQDRPCKFQVAVFHGHRRQLLPQLAGELGEFLHGQAVPAAMAAHQHPQATVGALREQRTGHWIRRGGGRNRLHGQDHLAGPYRHQPPQIDLGTLLSQA